MTRTDHVTIIDLIRAVKPTVAQMPRGYIDVDLASISGVTTTLLVGTCQGIPMYRKSGLDDGKYEYDDSAATNIATNV
jgi:hypothetical protein